MQSIILSIALGFSSPATEPVEPVFVEPKIAHLEQLLVGGKKGQIRIGGKKGQIRI